jgi:hypothetical protein
MVCSSQGKNARKSNGGAADSTLMSVRRSMVADRFRAQKHRYLVHPLFMNEWMYHPSSLMTYSNVRFAGAESMYAYLKVGFTFFNLHIEQLLLPFVHHQLCGTSYWIIIPYAELDKLVEMAMEIIKVRGRWWSGKMKLPYQEPGESELRVIARALLYSKQLFPPMELLRQFKIDHYELTLRANQVLLAHGGFAHFGFNLARGETHSFAINIASVEWFRTGGPEFVVRFFSWVKLLANMPSQVEFLSAHGLDANTVSMALNQCPHAFSCSWLSGMVAELSNPRCMIALSIEERTTYMGQLRTALRVLHDPEVHSFIKKQTFEKDPDSVCNCE